MRRSGIWWLAVLLSACTYNIPGLSQLQPTATVRPSPTPTSTAQAASGYVPECAFTWTSQGLPELSRQIARDLDKRGITNVEVSAWAFGEDCRSNDWKVVYGFEAMQTNFNIEVRVTDLSDKALLERYLLSILQVLANYPPGVTPGPMSGEVVLRFISFKGAVQTLGSYSYMMSVLEEHPDGKGLLEELDIEVPTPSAP